MNEVTVELLIKSVINDFKEYQIEWLTSHNDIEFCPDEEALLVGFLTDTAEQYIAEHIQ